LSGVDEKRSFDKVAVLRELIAAAGWARDSGMSFSHAMPGINTAEN